MRIYFHLQRTSEAGETQSWLETTVECEYLTKEVGSELFQLYNNVIGKLVTMEPWWITMVSEKVESKLLGACLFCMSLIVNVDPLIKTVL